MIFQNKIEVIPFKDFMSRPAAIIQKKTPLQTNIFSFIPAITVKGLLPFSDMGFTLFLVASSAVVVIALSETLFAHSGFIEVSAGVSSVLKFALPVAGYGAIFWLLSTL